MAGGYLGKISAVVSANTGDYVRKLNDSASTTRSFAKSISSDLSKASRDASRSIESILTPLQRFERAIQNAASQKLAFRGFDGAIQTVEQLRKAIEKVADRPVELQFLLKQTGLKTLEEIRQTIGSISEKNLQLALSVGGLEGLRRLRSEVEEVNGKLVNVKVETDATELDRLISVFSQISPERVRQLKIDVETRQIEQAVALNKQLVSVATEITSSYSRAKQQFAGFGLEIQAALGPAFKSADSGILKLLDDIDNRIPVTESRFQSLAAEAKKAIATIGTFSEAQQKLGGLATGNELSFQFPRLNANLTEAARAGREAAALPAARIAADPEIEGLTRQISRVSELAVAAAARVRSAAGGKEAAAAAAEYDRLNTVLESLVARLDAVAAGEQRIAAAAKQAAADAAAPLIARARAQQDFYETSQRLQQQAAADAAAPLIARARAEQEYYATSQRLQQQAASDEAAVLTARARAQQDFYETSRRLQQQAASDEAAPLIARARAEQDFYETSRRLREQAGSDSIAASYEGVTSSLADRRQMRARQMLGMEPRAISEVPRELDAVGGRINALNSQIDAMPVALQQVMLPTLRALQNEFVQVAGAVRPTIDQLNQLDVAIQHGEASARRLASGLEISRGFGGAGNVGIEFGLDQRAAAGYVAQLQILQQAIGRASAEARGPAVASMNVLRNAIAQAMANGTLETRATRAEIARLTQEAVQSAAAVTNTSAAALGRRMQRAGDVSRQGVDRWSLALNQGAFAIDDFLSSTGGVEQKLRAVSNNITQMAFLLGGTTGLFIGLGAVLVGQVAVGLARWISGGRTAEDQTQALNDALARQKSLVEEVAQAFKSLGDEISRLSFSQSGGTANSFRREMQEVRKKQKEARDESVAGFDPNVIAARAARNQADRELKEATDPGLAARLLRDRADAVRQEKQAVANANRPLGNGEDIRRSVVNAMINEALRNDASGSNRNPNRREMIERARQRAVDETPLGNDLASRSAQRAAVQARIDALRPNVRAPSFLEYVPFTGRNRDSIDRRVFADLEVTLKRLNNEILAAVDELSVQIVEKSRGVGIAIQSAQEDVAEAIRRGVKGASAFQAALDNTAKQLEDAQEQLRNARDIEDPAAREAAVRFAEGRVRDVEMRRDAINEAAREIRLGRTFGGDRTTSALSAIQGNERFANEFGRITAVLQERLDREVAARRELEQAIAAGDEAAQAEARARLEAAQSAGDAAAAMAEAALAMEQAVSRLRKIVSDAVSASESIANDAQKRLNENPTAANRTARDDAERQLIADRQRVAEAQNAIDYRRSVEQRGDARLVDINAELESIRQERERLAEEARISGTIVNPDKARELADREARLQAEREQRLFDLTEAERRQADAIAYEIDARRRLAEQLERERQFDEEVRNRRNPVGDPMRGLDLAETPAQQAARDARQGMADINAAFDEKLRELTDRNNGLPFAGQGAEAQKLRDERAAAFNNFAQEQMRSVAPMVMGFREERLNAMLQGPSRAPLNVADAQTTEGARELNRLLRGDDPNKDVNLVELQKQTEALERVIKAIEENAAGAIVDIRG